MVRINTEPDESETDNDESHKADNARRERNVLVAFWSALGAVSAVLLAFSVGSTQTASSVRQFALAILVAAAAACLGALLGFLFGLPRSGDELRSRTSRSSQPNGPDTSDASGNEPGAKRPARANNNLLEISDWLTKVIVGAGLVGLKDLVRWVSGLAQTVGAGVGLEGAAQPVFGGAVLTFYFGWGFLFLYIQTRTIISVIFVATERALEDVLGRRIREVAGKVRDAVVTQVKDQVRDAVEEQVREEVSVGTIMQLLYSSPRKAERTAREFLTRNAENALVWLYLACALGQQHAGTSDQVARARFRDEALEALRQALRINPDMISLARGFMYEDDENHLEGDDDLASFRDDESFQQLLGPPPAAQ